MRARPFREQRPEQGFVLVGVVMFVLALTILGLSLYGLSTYEGQFFTDTQSEEQALFQAEGGMALVQELLRNPPYQLSQSHQAQGYEHIVRATAWQEGPIDSTGPMNWSKKVHIRVRTLVGSQYRIVEAEFTPSERRSPYKRLFTGVTSIMYTARDAGNRSRVGSTTLTGPLWQTTLTPSDTTWLRDVEWSQPHQFLGEAAPTPDVAGFMTQHYASAVLAPYDTVGEHKLTLDAGSDAARQYFYRPKRIAHSSSSVGRHYEFFIPIELEILVRGTAVWLAPGGIRFDNRVLIKRASGAGQAPTLIIVTAPNGRDQEFGDYRDMGLWFFDQGLKVEDGVRVILVSSGHVRLEVASAGSGGGGGGGGNRRPALDPPGGGSGAFDVLMPNLTIFADRITMMGPRHQDGVMVLTHPSSMDALMDDLISRGALPNAAGSATGGFVMEAGSWRLP